MNSINIYGTQEYAAVGLATCSLDCFQIAMETVQKGEGVGGGQQAFQRALAKIHSNKQTKKSAKKNRIVYKHLTLRVDKNIVLLILSIYTQAIYQQTYALFYRRVSHLLFIHVHLLS